MAARFRTVIWLSHFRIKVLGRKFNKNVQPANFGPENHNGKNVLNVAKNFYTSGILKKNCD